MDKFAIAYLLLFQYPMNVNVKRSYALLKSYIKIIIEYLPPCDLVP